ncbi:MAG: nucleoside hydrolase [Eubacterium sp.]|nr:nucleoside hydrolase [Eubacterium sp.]
MNSRNKIIKTIIACIPLLCLLCSCGTNTKKANKETDSAETTSDNTEQTEQSPRKLIIDTDTGADDASALILAAKSKNIDILGVTTLAGNVEMEQSTRNALMALEIAGSNAPVYPGADKTFSGKKISAASVFGKDGMGDANLINPKGVAQDTDAVTFILDTVKKYPDQVEIILLGPATNIANAIKRDPETMKHAKMIWSLGTTGLGAGNASPVAEFNVYGDAEAYKEMLDFGVPITIVGLDMCDGESKWTNDQFETLKKANEIGKFIYDSFGKIREFYAGNDSEDSTMNCDSVAMMCLVNPDFIKSSIQVHGSCITDKGETYAQVIFYKEGFTYDVVENDFDYNVTLITEVDKANYFNNYLQTIK